MLPLIAKYTAYFHDGFRFRFRNKATPSGSLDHWHIDYVGLDKGATIIADTFYVDASFGYVPRHFLKNYSAMPYKQYVLTEMGHSFANFIRDNNNITLNVKYQFDVYDAANSYQIGCDCSDTSCTIKAVEVLYALFSGSYSIFRNLFLKKS